MSNNTVDIINCRCGRLPEVNTSLRGYSYSLSCKCGGEEINFLCRSNKQETVVKNWKALILNEPLSSQVYHLPYPEADVRIPSFNYPRHAGNPLAQWIESRGGHCGGSRGGCS